jgi:hypothetical protein
VFQIHSNSTWHPATVGLPSIDWLKDVKGKIMENLQETMAFPLKYIGGSGNFFPVNQSNDSTYYLYGSVSNPWYPWWTSK